MNYVGKAVRKDNQAEFRRAVHLATDRNLVLSHFATSYGRFAGVHRYVLATGPAHSCRGKNVVACFETPYSRCYQPSIKGEAACIAAVIHWIETTHS